VFFPQTHRPGKQAEVDFGEVTINLRGEPVTFMLFALRLSFSGKAVHRIFASGGTEAYLEGHLHAFTTLGGVPTVGRQVRVHLHASDLVVYDGRTEVARHQRLMAKSSSRLDLDHYLEALLRKPGALPGSTVLEQARAAGKFTPVHDAWWEAVRKTHGDAAGTRAPGLSSVRRRCRPAIHAVAHHATVRGSLRGPLKCQQVVVAYRPQGQGAVALFVEQDGEPVVLLAHHDPLAPFGMPNA
jgi:hypothetical protein